MKNSQKGSTRLLIITVIALILIGGGTYLYLNNYSKTNNIPEIQIETISNTSNSETEAESEANSNSNSNANSNTTSPTVVTAYIKSIEGNKITLDYFDSLSGEKALEAKIADGKCSKAEISENNCLPNDVYDRNINTKLRTFNLSANVNITTATAFEKDPTGIVKITLEDLKNNYISKYTLPYKISIDSKGEVTNIEEIYRP